MSRYAKSQLDNGKQETSEPVSPEQMELRRKVAAELRALWSRPMTKEEKEFWQKFDEELERERLTFR